MFTSNTLPRLARASALGRAGVIPLAALIVSACATVDVDRMLATTNQDLVTMSDARLTLALEPAQRQALAEQASELLKAPLGETQAVQLAVVNSPAIQALLAQAWADTNAAGQVGRIPNPVFGIEHVAAGNELDLTRRLSFGLLDLLTLPQRKAYADRRVAQVQSRLVADAIDEITQIRQQWVIAVAARQSLIYAEQVQTLADTTGELARRLHAVGNFSRLQQARQQAFYADASTQLASARLEATAARERLIRRLGLTDPQAGALQLPDRLPDLPALPRSEAEIAAVVPAARIDVRLAQLAFESAAKVQGLKLLTSWTDLEVAVRRDTLFNSPPGSSTQLNGYEASLRLPVFDWGGLQRDAMTATTLAAANRLEATLRSAGSTLRESYSAYRTGYDIVQHFRRDVLPVRQIEFVADVPGDWSLHCHKSHHTMNAMGHTVPTMLGIEQKDLAQKITGLIPDYMAMGDKGMEDMTAMQMPLPENTLPMMTGDGPFGSVAMGGMFSIVKVRADQKPGDYSDPGWYRHPAGTVAYEWTGELADPLRSDSAGPSAMDAGNMPAGPVEVQVRKPAAHHVHGDH